MTLIPLGILSASAGGATRISVAGYFFGGYAGASRVSAADKFDFALETKSTIASFLTVAIVHLSGFSNSGVAGYAGGGITATTVSTVNKFAFPADTRTTLGTGLSAASGLGAAMANYGTAGYQALGDTTGGTAFVSTVDKFAFPADSRTTLGTGLSGSRGYLAAMANRTVAGYFMGGRVSPFAYITTVDKFAFSDDSRSTLATGLSASNGATHGGFADSGVAGYMAGGVIGSGTVNKFAFPSDTRTTLATGMSADRYWNTAVSNSGVAGYVGLAGLNTASSSVDKFAFPSDTRSTLASILTSATSGHGSGFADEGAF